MGNNDPMLPCAKLPLRLVNAEEYRKLSPEAILLYTILWDRMGLSKKNPNDYRDQSGLFFVKCSNESIQKILRCKHDRATKTLRELESVGLIQCKKLGLGRSQRIYVYPIGKRCEKQSSGMRDFLAQDCEKNASNQYYINHPFKYINLDTEKSQYGITEEEACQNVLSRCKHDDVPCNLAEKIVRCLARYIFACSITECELRNNLERIQDEHIKYIYNSILLYYEQIEDVETFIYQKVIEMKIVCTSDLEQRLLALEER